MPSGFKVAKYPASRSDADLIVIVVDVFATKMVFADYSSKNQEFLRHSLARRLCKLPENTENACSHTLRYHEIAASCQVYLVSRSCE